MVNILYLFLSVSLSAGRNITSKKTATDTNKKAQFFLSQTVLFGSATVLLLLFGIGGFTKLSPITLIYGIIYGMLLVLSQWMFTLGLKNGVASVCTVIYSLGFIIPTVLGTFFWNEALTFLNIIGVCVAVVIILLSSKKEQNEKKENKSFVLFVLIGMIASGGLGIMQKVQQASYAADDKEVFLFIAFAFAFICSLSAFLLCREKISLFKTKSLYPAFAGLCFGGANLCNTILAGRMKSAVFFPLQNISTILFTTLLSVLIFKEKVTRKTVTILFLSIAVILLLGL